MEVLNRHCTKSRHTIFSITRATGSLSHKYRHSDRYCNDNLELKIDDMIDDMSHPSTKPDLALASAADCAHRPVPAGAGGRLSTRPPDREPSPARSGYENDTGIKCLARSPWA